MYTYVYSRQCSKYIVDMVSPCMRVHQLLELQYCYWPVHVVQCTNKKHNKSRKYIDKPRGYYWLFYYSK